MLWHSRGSCHPHPGGINFVVGDVLAGRRLHERWPDWYAWYRSRVCRQRDGPYVVLKSVSYILDLSVGPPMVAAWASLGRSQGEEGA